MPVPGESAQPRRALKGAVLASLALLAVLAIVWWRTRGGSFEWQLFLSTLYRIDWRWLALSILLMVFSFVCRAWRWEVMLRPLGARVGIRKLTYNTIIGFTAGVLLGRVGEVVRPYLIAVSAGVPFSSQMAAWLLERILDLLAVLLLFGFALIRVPAHGLALGPGLRWVLGAGGYLVTAIGILCVIFLLAFRNFSEPAQQRILSGLSFLPANYYKRSETLLKAFARGMESTRELKSVGLLLGYTGLLWAIIVVSNYALFRAFSSSVRLTFTDVVVMVGFLAFGGLIQIPGLGGGMQVTALVVLTEIFGVALESASGIALFLWVLTFVVIVPLGLLCAFHEGWNWSKLKQLSSQEIPEDEPL